MLMPLHWLNGKKMFYLFKHQNILQKWNNCYRFMMSTKYLRLKLVEKNR
jgi:hypothetical protein